MDTMFKPVPITIDGIKYTNSVELLVRLTDWYKNEDVFVVNINGVEYGIDAGRTYILTRLGFTVRYLS